MNKHSFSRGDLVIQNQSHALGIVVNPIDPISGDRFVQVKWLISKGHTDGGFFPENLSAAPIQELHEALKILEDAATLVKNALPLPGKFKTGDEVYRANSGHSMNPYTVVHMTDDQAVIYRPVNRGGVPYSQMACYEIVTRLTDFIRKPN